MTEEDAQRYLNERTDAMLVLCDNYGYDGILIDYTGLSMVGMQEDVLQQYKARQQNFFSRVLDWRIKHTDKTLVFTVMCSIWLQKTWICWINTII